jgi:mannose-6-phosphate isomerase-like protein (cupin superfamily)
MIEKVNLAEKFEQVDKPFSPRIVGYMNDLKLQVAKTHGEFVWHTHPDTDDLFIVLKGKLIVQLRDGDVEVGPGELLVVPRGIEHCPRADEETHVLLIEPRGTPNTGDAGGPLTAPEVEL